MKKQKRLGILLFLAAFLCSACLTGIVPTRVEALARDGIKGNGTGGITIDINASPYTDFANIPTWGEYAYGPAGCAWFASARVKQLTGKGSMIYSGTSWYNYQYANFGFSRGSGIQAKALACYVNHVAVVESVSGNQVVLSEGGSIRSSGNYGFCVIRVTTVGEVESNDGYTGAFLGYVYLGVSPGNTPAASNPEAAGLSYSDEQTTYVVNNQGTTTGLYAEIHNPGRAAVEKCGVRMWDSLENQIADFSENISSDIQTYSRILQDYPDILGTNHIISTPLVPGEKYTYEFFAVSGGREYKSKKLQFQTEDKQKPVISNVKVTDVDATGYTVSCTVTDNGRIARVQFPTWTLSNDQDDVQKDWWNNPAAAGTGKDGTYTYRVNIAQHNGEEGMYRTHIYAYDLADNYEKCVVPDTEVPKQNTEGDAEGGQHDADKNQQNSKEYLVMFHANGGAANSDSRWTVGQKLQQLPTASRDGYTFLGWYTLASGGRQVDTGTVFTSDTTVFAQWQKDDVQKPGTEQEYNRSNIKELTETKAVISVETSLHFVKTWGYSYGTSRMFMEEYPGSGGNCNVNNYTVTLENLAPGTTYFFQIYYC